MTSFYYHCKNINSGQWKRDKANRLNVEMQLA